MQTTDTDITQIAPWLGRVNSWLETWSPYCGAPRAVFEGQWRAMLREVFDEIERRAEANMLRTGKLEGMHYAALKDIRRELGILRSNVPDETREHKTL